MLKLLAAGTAGVALGSACRPTPTAKTKSGALPDLDDLAPGARTQYPFELPRIAYHYGAIDRAIDAETMQLHHQRHHQAYTDKLNEVLKDAPELRERPVLELLAGLHELPEPVREGIRNQGGGYVNHAMLWAMLAQEGGGEPTEELAQAVIASFGSFDVLKREMSEAAVTLFGSGWAWLTVDASGGLSVQQSPNQDSPLSEGRRPLLGIDVWEHAYYLRYQNRRSEYVERFWDVVNWYQILINFRASTA